METTIMMETTTPAETATMMETEITRHWWAIALRGAAAVLFGVVALVWPGLTLAALIALFGAFALVDGVFAGVAAFGAIRRGWHAALLLVNALLSIGVGVATFFLPGLTALSLVVLIAAWSVFTGVAGIVAAFADKERSGGARWGMGLSGLLSVVFGVALLAFPGAGALTLVWVIGIYALLFGGMLIGTGFALRPRAAAPRPLTHAPSGA